MSNVAEANVIIKILRNIIDANDHDENHLEELLKSIGIITGYNA